MNELAVIASETHEKAVAYFKVAEQYGYKFIMEVKEIRDKQYYKALGFDSFDVYCEKSWGTKRDFMDQRIQIASAFGNEWDFADTYRQLGHSKSLMLARMEPEVREQIQATHDVSDMTVKKLSQLEKQVKDAEESAAKAWSEATQWKKAAQSQKPQTVPPTDYEETKRHNRELNETNARLNVQMQELKQTHSEKTSKADETSHAVRKLRESFKNLLTAVSQEHHNAKFFYEMIHGNPQAHQTVQSFINEFGTMVSEMFVEWKSEIEIKAS